jgi:ABC-type cobalamin transport system permease subunit
MFKGSKFVVISVIMLKLLWILCMGHDIINIIYFSEVNATQIGHILWVRSKCIPYSTKLNSK